MVEHKQSVYALFGFSPAQITVLMLKKTLIKTLRGIIKERNLTQQEAATLCGTDQPTLSKILRGRPASVTIDKLTEWLAILDHTVVIRVLPTWDVANEDIGDMIRKQLALGFNLIESTMLVGDGKISKKTLQRIIAETNKRISEGCAEMRQLYEAPKIEEKPPAEGESRTAVLTTMQLFNSRGVLVAERGISS